MTTSTQETYLPEPAWANIIGFINADKPQLPIWPSQSAYAMQKHRHDISWLINKLNNSIINSGADLFPEDEPEDERFWRTHWAIGIQDLYDYGHLDEDDLDELHKFNLKNYHRVQEEYGLIFNQQDNEDDFILQLAVCNLANADEEWTVPPPE